MSRLSCGLMLRFGIVALGLRWEGFSSHFSRFSGVFGKVFRKIWRPDQWPTKERSSLRPSEPLE